MPDKIKCSNQDCFKKEECERYGIVEGKHKLKVIYTPFVPVKNKLDVFLCYNFIKMKMEKK